MSSSFEPIEKGIERVARRFSGTPRKEVLVTRLYFHVYLKMNETYNRSLKRHGLNTTSWAALMMIYASPDNQVFPSDLSKVVASSRTHATRLADELVDKGFVSRRASGEDRRKMILSLTRKGVALIEKLLPEHRVLLERIWKIFSAADLGRFEKLLRKLLLQVDG